jgi:hypothetical protein
LTKNAVKAFWFGHSRTVTAERSAYVRLKRAQVIHCLPASEQEELERLERRKRLKSEEQSRLAELWDRAFDLHDRRRHAGQRLR